MTELEMVEHLRNAGYRVHLPPDLREAGPWERSSGSREEWQRPWMDSAALSATFVWRVPPGHLCADRHRTTPPPEFRWTARLVGASRYGRVSGYTLTLTEAKAAADDALLKLLRVARRERMAGIAERNQSCTPTDTLKL